jgi:haloalkane dehalogenase
MKVKDTNTAAFPYESHYVNALGSKLHYVDEGEGNPILFLHGVPTSCYLWRNVIPWLTKSSRCIAPDLIGMGKSDKPDLAYRVFDFIRYFDDFVSELNLNNITLVMHGWGSVIGLDYAMRNSDKIKGLVFIEPYLQFVEGWSHASLPMQYLGSFLSNHDNPHDLITKTDYFFDKVFSGCTMRKLTDEEMEYYQAPFANPQHRQLLWQFLLDLPYNENAKDVANLISQYSDKLVHSSIPKLMLYAIPGYSTTVDMLIWAKDHLKNLKLVDLGEDLHYVEESKPKEVGTAIASWMTGL